MSLATLGELLIDFVADETGVEVGDVATFHKKPGGAPANVAVAVRRLGMRSAFLGQVGDDPFGHYLAQTLRACEVDISGLRFSDEARTALAFVSLKDDGDRSFSFYRHPSADMLMRPRDVATDIIEAHDVFHFGSITMIHQPAREATLAAVRYAKRRGKLLTYDPNLRLALWTDEKSALEGLNIGLEHAHIVKVSAEEVDFMTRDGNINNLWRDHIQMIVVTDGPRGATLYTRGGKFYHAGYKVEALDTTGAGDAFMGGLIVGILEQRAQNDGLIPYVEQLLSFANAVGAMTTLAKGAINAIPTREAVHAFIDAQRTLR